MRHSLIVALLGVALLAPVAPALSAATSGNAVKNPVDPEALLFAMSDFMAAAKSFSVNMLTGYDVVQDSGQKIEFLEGREITLARPDKLRVNGYGGNGRTELLLFDGTNMTILDGAAGVYSQVAQPGSVNDAIMYFVRDLQMRLPLSALLTTQVTQEFRDRLVTIDYVDWTTVLGEPAHHLAGQMDNVDFQIWIADSDEPLPLRIVLTYPDPGLPQFWADFYDWNLRPAIAAKTFKTDLPATARQIPFAVQMRPAAGDADTEVQP